MESWGLCKLPRCFASLLARDQRCCTKPHRTARGGDGLPAHCSALRLHRSPGPGRAELHVRPTVWGAAAPASFLDALDRALPAGTHNTLAAVPAARCLRMVPGAARAAQAQHPPCQGFIPLRLFAHQNAAFILLTSPSAAQPMHWPPLSPVPHQLPVLGVGDTSRTKLELVVPKRGTRGVLTLRKASVLPGILVRAKGRKRKIPQSPSSIEELGTGLGPCCAAGRVETCSERRGGGSGVALSI